ncbi:hypothetical protein WME98_12610 [Sorangium sp. So ce296]|uniref:hypothetical protein n=1 Tax=Sorangium sp. So ce296 TaxID=3133296 RepID=UPI003F5D933A
MEWLQRAAEERARREAEERARREAEERARREAEERARRAAEERARRAAEERARREAEERARRAAEERARREAERLALEGARKDLSTEIQILERRLAAINLPCVGNALGEATAVLEGSASVADLQAQTRMVKSMTCLTDRIGAALSNTFPDLLSVRQRMQVEFSKAEDVAALERAVSRWCCDKATLQALDGCIRAAESATGFVEACEIAEVQLDRDVKVARQKVEAFLRAPDPARISAVRSAVQILRASYLELHLAARRVRLEEVIHTLAQPAWSQRLEAWWPGFSAEIYKLHDVLASDDWRGAAPILANLNEFLAEHARSIVEVLLRGGEAARLSSTPATYNEALGAWTAELHNEHGVLASIAQVSAKWHSLLDEELTQIRGPEELDGPACVHGGYDRWLTALRKQGGEVHLYAEDGIELALPMTCSSTSVEDPDVVHETVSVGRKAQ